MNIATGQAPKTESRPVQADELHLCNNFRHLMFALADISGRAAAARILYLEDDAPLSGSFKKRLSEAYPDIDLSFSTDAEQIAAFGGLPLSGLMRRNLRFEGGLSLKRSTQWALPILKGARFKTGFIYHSGLFTAKPASFSCDQVIMRESGLNNYLAFDVPWPKAIVRAACKQPPFRQVWGDEPWVDVIEVSRPEHLPVAVRAKGRALTFAGLLKKLDPQQAEKLADVFVPHPPTLGPGVAPRAVVLTQPIDAIGLCSTFEKHALYQQIVSVILAQGYEVHLKHHPIETVYHLDGCVTFDVNFPVELWAALGLPRFDLAVALCSASLMNGETLVAKRLVQLLSPTDLNVKGLAKWRARLPGVLDDLTQ